MGGLSSVRTRSYRRLSFASDVRLALIHRLCPAPFISLHLGFVFRNPIAFLDAPDKLVFLSGNLFPVIVGELAPLLTGLALELFPVAFDSVPIHLRLSSGRTRARWGPNF